MHFLRENDLIETWGNYWQVDEEGHHAVAEIAGKAAMCHAPLDGRHLGY